MDPFLVRLLIAVLVYFFFGLVIDELVKDHTRIFKLVLLFGCLFYLLLGKFLPF